MYPASSPWRTHRKHCMCTFKRIITRCPKSSRWHTFFMDSWIEPFKGECQILYIFQSSFTRVQMVTKSSSEWYRMKTETTYVIQRNISYEWNNLPFTYSSTIMLVKSWYQYDTCPANTLFLTGNADSYDTGSWKVCVSIASLKRDSSTFAVSLSFVLTEVQYFTKNLSMAICGTKPSNIPTLWIFFTGRRGKDCSIPNREAYACLLTISRSCVSIVTLFDISPIPRFCCSLGWTYQTKYAADIIM